MNKDRITYTSTHYIVQLTQGYSAIIDHQDYDRVSQHPWCVQQYKDKTGHGRSKVYAKCTINRTQVTLHRFILNATKGTIIDHINGDPLDNRRSNLRITDRKGNAANRPKDRVKKATSKYKGVSKSKEKWIAKIQINGQGLYLGWFMEETDAALAYNKAALKYFGEHAWLNQLP